MSGMMPQEIVHELDKYIIGQHDAKRAVAIALRNRWRRQQVEEPLRHEITPKNILMIGPTGVGKTEIARRLARLADAPFIKVEATKFTEVGYVGRDVDTIIRDLAEAAVKLTREAEVRKVRAQAADAFTLFERFEGKLEKFGNLTRAAIELAKDWRSDRYLRRLEALLLVGNPESLFVISGNGDVIEPEHPLAAIGSGGPYAQAAALALLQNSELSARDIATRALNIAADICIYTNRNLIIEELGT